MNDKVQVLQFVSAFDVGGTERHVATLLNNYDDERFDFQVACFRREGALLPELRAHADWGADYPINRLYGARTWRQQARLARHLRKRRVQVVHAYGFYANCFVIPAAKIARVPVIVGSIRDVGASWTPMQLRVERTICGMADSMLTNAEAVKEKLIADGYRADKIAVIRNGVDVARFERDEPCGQLRSEFGIPAQAPLVGVIARVDAVKGLDYFVDAAATVSNKLPDVRFIIVGDSFPTPEHRAYHRSLQERVRALGIEDRVVFAGNRSDVPEILSQLRLSVLPSLTEGMPNAVLESMAASVPVVATAVGGIPEVIEDGVNGLLVPSRDAVRLAAAIERLLVDEALATRLASAGNQTVHACFSVRRMARLTEEHYLGVLRQKGWRSRFPMRAPGPGCRENGGTV